LRREKAAAHAQRKPAVLGRVTGMMHAAGDTILGNEFHAQLSQNVAPPSPPHAPLAAVSQQQQVRTTSPGNSLSPDGAPQHTHTSLERAHPSFWLVRPVQGAAAAAAGHQDFPLLFPAAPATAAGEQQDLTTEQSVGQQQQVRTTSPGNSLLPDGAPQHTHTLLLNVLTRPSGASGAGSGGGGGRPAGLPSVPCVSSRAGRSGGLGGGSARGGAGGAGSQPVRSNGRVEAVRVDMDVIDVGRNSHVTLWAKRVPWSPAPPAPSTALHFITCAGERWQA